MATTVATILADLFSNILLQRTKVIPKFCSVNESDVRVITRKQFFSDGASSFELLAPITRCCTTRFAFTHGGGFQFVKFVLRFGIIHTVIRKSRRKSEEVVSLITGTNTYRSTLNIFRLDTLPKVLEAFSSNLQDTNASDIRTLFKLTRVVANCKSWTVEKSSTVLLRRDVRTQFCCCLANQRLEYTYIIYTRVFSKYTSYHSSS